jgi:uncharacterized protein YjiS (DUF1127 family)
VEANMPIETLPLRDPARLADRRPRGGHVFGLSWIWSRLVSAFRTEVVTRDLAAMSDHALNDIGLTRGEIMHGLDAKRRTAMW